MKLNVGDSVIVLSLLPKRVARGDRTELIDISEDTYLQEIHMKAIGHHGVITRRCMCGCEWPMVKFSAKVAGLTEETYRLPEEALALESNLLGWPE